MTRDQIIGRRIQAALDREPYEFMVKMCGTVKKARHNAGRAEVGWSTYWCSQCKHVFTDGDTVYRRSNQRRITLCGECVQQYQPRSSAWSQPTPCRGGCGVLIVNVYRDARHQHTTCSGHCAREAFNATRRAASTVTCAGCGQSFTQKRSDAAYCSGACRQRAYRTRRSAS